MEAGQWCSGGQQFLQSLRGHTGFGLLPTDIDLNKDRRHDVGLSGAAGNFLCQVYGIDRLDHIHLPDDLAHLIGLQVPDQVARNPLQMQKGLLGFIFLHAVFADLPDRKNCEKKFTAKGLDEVEFYLSPNAGQPLKPLTKIISGGEQSRFMLALKVISGKYDDIPSLVFDEIDTGVSGEIADRMADMMQEMGEQNRQVISITHLPQIAARGRAHYKVYKKDSDTETNSHIRRLTDEERVEEIAHMLSGATLTEAALSNAKALLNSD